MMIGDGPARSSIEDVYFEHDPDPVRLRIETAAVFGVRPESVVVESLGDPWLGLTRPEIRWLRDEENMPGDFPAWWYLHPPVMDPQRLDTLLSDLSGRLRIAAVTQDPDPFTNDLVLHGPDGSRVELPIEQRVEDDYAIVLTPRMRALLDRLYQKVALRNAS